MFTVSTGNLPNKLQVPKGFPPETIAAIEHAARDTFVRHGVSAFQMSREAAISHEAGHAVVGAHEGVNFQSIRIFSRSMPPFGTVWGGWCAEDNDRGHPIGPDISVESELSIARVTIAGLAGEAVCRLDKPGSSLDELEVSRRIGFNAAFKLADPALSDAEYFAYAQELWHERVWRVAVAILCENWEPFMRLVEHLQRHGKIKGSKLRTMLAQVRRITS